MRHGGSRAPEAARGNVTHRAQQEGLWVSTARRGEGEELPQRPHRLPGNQSTVLGTWGRREDAVHSHCRAERCLSITRYTAETR